MLQETTLPPRRKHKRSTLKAELRERRSAREEKEPRNLQRPRSGARPATKRTLHYFMKLWQTAGEECLQILDGDPEYDWDPRILRSH